ncbi:MAG TPA: hypothetical protein VEW03_04925 [Longimicrobiaceae bacterium]|nr:hypothetical protein [Longimicrobiaceae bacterium]
MREARRSAAPPPAPEPVADAWAREAAWPRELPAARDPGSIADMRHVVVEDDGSAPSPAGFTVQPRRVGPWSIPTFELESSPPGAVPPVRADAAPPLGHVAAAAAAPPPALPRAEPQRAPGAGARDHLPPGVHASDGRQGPSPPPRPFAAPEIRVEAAVRAPESRASRTMGGARASDVAEAESRPSAAVRRMAEAMGEAMRRVDPAADGEGGRGPAARDDRRGTEERAPGTGHRAADAGDRAPEPRIAPMGGARRAAEPAARPAALPEAVQRLMRAAEPERRGREAERRVHIGTVHVTVSAPPAPPPPVPAPAPQPFAAPPFAAAAAPPAGAAADADPWSSYSRILD